MFSLRLLLKYQHVTLMVALESESEDLGSLIILQPGNA